MAKTYFICLLFLGLSAWAAELDSASTEALEKTKKLMNSPEERQAYIKDHADAQAADKKVDALTSDPKLKNEMYGTAGDIYGDMVKKTGGDVDKQKKILEEAMKDPEAFFNGLTPDQQRQIRDIAGKMNPFNDPHH